nr:hypothetical protein [Tanacetum cinerariifolium]
MNKMTGTPLGEMADQTIMGVFITQIMGLFSLVTRMVEVLERVTLLLWSLLLILLTCHEDIEAVNHEELLSRMTHNMREAAMDALSVSIQDKPGSYITAAEGSRPKQSATKGSKLDPSISKEKFHSLFLENLCEGVYVTIPRKVVEMMALALSRLKSVSLLCWTPIPPQCMGRSSFALCLIEINAKDVLKESLTIGVHLIDDTGFAIKSVSIPITVFTHVVPAPIVEMTNDGFQTVGKKKKGKSKSINGG